MWFPFGNAALSVASLDEAVGVVLVTAAAASAVAGHVAGNFGVIGREDMRVFQHVHRTWRHISFDIEQGHVEARSVRGAGLGPRRLAPAYSTEEPRSLHRSAPMRAFQPSDYQRTRQATACRRTQ